MSRRRRGGGGCASEDRSKHLELKCDGCLATCREQLHRVYIIENLDPDGAANHKAARAFSRMATCYQRQRMFPEAAEYWRLANDKHENASSKEKMEECQKLMSHSAG